MPLITQWKPVRLFASNIQVYWHAVLSEPIGLWVVVSIVYLIVSQCSLELTRFDELLSFTQSMHISLAN